MEMVGAVQALLERQGPAQRGFGFRVETAVVQRQADVAERRGDVLVNRPVPGELQLERLPQKRLRLGEPILLPAQVAEPGKGGRQLRASAARLEAPQALLEQRVRR